MHNFDAERRDEPVADIDRRITVNGETLTFKPRVGADMLAKFFDSPEVITPTCPHCQRIFSVGSPRPEQDSLAALDTLILAWLDPGQEEAWARVRSNDCEQPLSIREAIRFGYYVIGALTGRPTDSPSGSSSTSDTAGTSSTDGSPSPAAV